MVLFEPVFGTAVEVVTPEALLDVGMTVGRDAEEGRVGIGRMADVDKFAGIVIISDSILNNVGVVAKINITVRDVIWFDGRSTIDTTPREESKMVEIFVPPAEIVRFTEALETEETVLM